LRKWLEDNEDYEPEIVVFLRPTTPLKKAATIDSVVKGLIVNKAEIVRTVTAVEGVHHPYWMYRMDRGCRIAPFVKERYPVRVSIK